VSNCNATLGHYPNSHLHSFKINGKEYGDPDLLDDEFENGEYGDHGLWVRPKAMFIETVEVNGQSLPRFQYLGPK
jgi:hypothetical protein